MSSANILVVEDNVDTAENIRVYLQHYGFSCDITHSGLSGVSMFRQGYYDLVILDLMLPDLNGYDVCQQLREVSDTPIIMLTAKVADEDLVKGLGQGADDYIKKPYSNKELIARVQAHLRRRQPTEAKQETGPFTHDICLRSITIGDQALDFTKTEYLIFQYLLNSPNQVFSREQLFLAAFDATHESYERTVDVHIHNLRKKINKAGLERHGIEAVYGMGYKLVLP